MGVFPVNVLQFFVTPQDELRFWSWVGPEYCASGTGSICLSTRLEKRVRYGFLLSVTDLIDRGWKPWREIQG